MISCTNIARLIKQGWRLEVVQDTIREGWYHARVIGPKPRDTSHNHLGETVLQAIDSLDLYIAVAMPASAQETSPGRKQQDKLKLHRDLPRWCSTHGPHEPGACPECPTANRRTDHG